MLRGMWRASRPAALCVAALGLTVGVLGVGAGVASASHSKRASATHSERSTFGVAPLKPVTNFPEYVGGHGQANNKLSTIDIGVVNQMTATAAPTVPWTTGTTLAEKYINQH
ncbi:MAG: hypothetical protein ACRDV8_09920, partial [Acidimicrobiales bacterium]